MCCRYLGIRSYDDGVDNNIINDRVGGGVYVFSLCTRTSTWSGLFDPVAVNLDQLTCTLNGHSVGD